MTASIEEATAQLTAPGQMFEMETVEIDGYPVRTWKNAPPNLRAVLEQSAARGDLGFLVYEDESMTFGEHFRAAAHLANILRDRYGVEKGDRVAIAMRNYPEWSVAFWAAAACGAVIVPLNAWWTAPELVYGFEDSGSKVVFLDEERAERLQDELPKLGLAGAIVAKPTKDTPPMFLVYAYDDPVDPRNALYLALAMKDVGVPCELHMYATGGHGYGMRDTGHPVNSWPDRLVDWMYKQGYMKR